MNDNKILETISKRLGVLIALQISPPEQAASVIDSVALLDRLGLKTVEIADILGTTTNSVGVMKNRLKNKK